LLRIALSQQPLIDVVGVFGDAESALAGVSELNPRVVILDIELPGSMNGVQLGLRLRRLLPELGVILLSNHGDPEFVASLPADVLAGWSYLQKRSISEVAVLERAVAGATTGMVMLDPSLFTGMRPRVGGLLERLTPRQQEILGLIAQGFTNGQSRRGCTWPRNRSRIRSIRCTSSSDSTAASRRRTSECGQCWSICRKAGSVTEPNQVGVLISTLARVKAAPQD